MFSGNEDSVSKNSFQQKRASKPLHSTITLPKLSLAWTLHISVSSDETQREKPFTDFFTTGDKPLRPKGTELSWLFLPHTSLLFISSLKVDLLGSNKIIVYDADNCSQRLGSQ